MINKFNYFYYGVFHGWYIWFALTTCDDGDLPLVLKKLTLEKELAQKSGKGAGAQNGKTMFTRTSLGID